MYVLRFLILGFLLTGCTLGNLEFGANPSVLRPLQGGTGLSSATAGDVGKVISVTDDSPLTYGFATDANSGGGGAGNVATSTTDVSGYATFFTSNAATPATIGGDVDFTWQTALNKLSVANLAATNATSTDFRTSVLNATSTTLGTVTGYGLFTVPDLRLVNGLNASSTSNFLNISVNGNILFTSDNVPTTRSLGVNTQSTLNTAGNTLSVSSGGGNGSGAGGDLLLTSGAGGSTGAGGSVSFEAGAAGGGNAAGGASSFSGGTGSGSGNGGTIDFSSGNGGDTGGGGTMTFTTGDGGGTSGAGGNVQFLLGNANGGNNNGGSLILRPGLKSGSGVDGTVQFNNNNTGRSAVFNTSLIASSDKTYFFPNLTGTFAVADALQNVSFANASTTNSTTTGSFAVGSLFNARDGYASTTGFLNIGTSLNTRRPVSGDLFVSNKATTTVALWIGSAGDAKNINIAAGDLFVQDDIETTGGAVYFNGGDFEWWWNGTVASTTGGVIIGTGLGNLDPQSGDLFVSNHTTSTTSIFANLGVFGSGAWPNSTTTLFVSGATFLQGNATTTGRFVVGSNGALGSKKGCLKVMSSSAVFTYIYYNGVTEVISASSCEDTGSNTTSTVQVGQ